MTAEAAGSVVGRLAAELSPGQRILAWLLASTSGAAILAYAFAGLPMSFTVFFAVLPTGLLLTGIVLAGRNHYSRLRGLHALIVAGAFWGLIGTFAYDIVRPVLKWLCGFSFDPYKAIPYFGYMMTGLPVSDPRAIAAGWIYHFWNGISFAVMFALLWPRGGALPGMLWALLLQALMMIIYPGFLRVRLADPGFLVMGLVGHTVWGMVVGAGLRRRFSNAPAD